MTNMVSVVPQPYHSTRYNCKHQLVHLSNGMSLHESEDITCSSSPSHAEDAQLQQGSCHAARAGRGQL